LYLQSQDFTSVSWVKSGMSITANNTTSPDGTTNGSLATASGGSSVRLLLQNFSATTGFSYTFSIYAKKNTNDFIQFAGASGVFPSTAYANFDLNNGVLGTVGSGATATITSVGNGWYRCTMTATATSTATTSFGYYLISSATAIRTELNTLSTSLYIWGAQVEAGAYVTTPIPTTTASATRIADSFSRSNIYTNGLITSSGGTWFVELRGNVALLRDGTANAIGIGDSNTLLTNSFIIRNSSSTASRFGIVKRVGGTLSVLFTNTTDTVKIAIKWNGSTADVFVNGTKQVSATAFTATNMEFLQGDGSQQPAFIQSMALYPSPLSDTDCTTITTL
jgi:hypothetical protein